jgi:enterochelin esterase-like enzyme
LILFFRRTAGLLGLISLLIASLACQAVLGDAQATGAVKTATVPVEYQVTASPTAEPATGLVITPTPTPRIELAQWTRQVVLVSAPALKDNMLGEADEQPVEIYLPPSYEDSDLRYPVVYFLPGFSSADDGSNQSFFLEDLAALLAESEIEEKILVVPNGANILKGSFYVNSPVTGNWEDFIVQDVIGYIDSNYRTIARPEGRGLGGFSMGGFGAINLAMRHPELFSAAYLLSPGLFDEDGLAQSMMFDSPNKPRNFLEETQPELQALTREEALTRISKYEGALEFTIAYGAAFAPNPEAPPPYFDFPMSLQDGDLERIPKLWKQWEQGFGGWQAKVKQNREHLLRLRGITIDYAEDDRLAWIPRGSDYLSQVLDANGIPNTLLHYPGNHGDRWGERLQQVMLPFFDDVLVDVE